MPTRPTDASRSALPPWTWIDETTVEVDGARFEANPFPVDREGSYVVAKEPALVRSYQRMLDAERPRTIVELGTKDGGSAALLAVAAQPDRLACVDLAPEVPPALQRLIDGRALQGRVVPFVGVDQSDRGALGEVMALFEGAPIDLVIDDASHILGPTLDSFELLFPLVRPGGLYIIEDWSADLSCASRLARHGLSGADLRFRLDVARHLVRVLNTPGGTVPPPVWDALAVAHAARDVGAGNGDTGIDGLISAIVDAAATADPAVLRGYRTDEVRPLSDLAVRLTLAAAVAPTLISQVIVDEYQVAVRRGPGTIESEPFTLVSTVPDAFGYVPMAGDR